MQRRKQEHPHDSYLNQTHITHNQTDPDRRYFPLSMTSLTSTLHSFSYTAPSPSHSLFPALLSQHTGRCLALNQINPLREHLSLSLR